MMMMAMTTLEPKHNQRLQLFESAQLFVRSPVAPTNYCTHSKITWWARPLQLLCSHIIGFASWE